MGRVSIHSITFTPWSGVIDRYRIANFIAAAWMAVTRKHESGPLRRPIRGVRPCCQSVQTIMPLIDQIVLSRRRRRTVDSQETVLSKLARVCAIALAMIALKATLAKLTAMIERA